MSFFSYYKPYILIGLINEPFLPFKSFITCITDDDMARIDAMPEYGYSSIDPEVFG